MAEYDPCIPYIPVDRLPAKEFAAQDEALRALVVEATVQQDDYKLGIFTEALEELTETNPGRGTYYRAAEVTEINPGSQQSQTRSLLDSLGLVYGDGLSEFGLKHVGSGIPLQRRSSLEKSRKRAAKRYAILYESEGGSLPEIQQ